MHFLCNLNYVIIKKILSLQVSLLFIFFSSVECQRFDWVTHKANCSKNEVQESDCDDKTRQETSGSKYKTDHCKNTLHKHVQNKNDKQDLNTNMKHSKENFSLLPINVDSSETFLSNSDNIETLRQKTPETVRQKTEVESHNVVVFVKYLKEKHKVELPMPCTGVKVIGHFSRILHVPVERLKLIHKGKLQTELTIVESLKPNSVFLAFGEMAESEDGLKPEDIELIMKQLSVERNVAIKALQKTDSLIDAIFEIGNDM